MSLEHLAVPENEENVCRMMGVCQKDKKVSLKGLSLAKSGMMTITTAIHYNPLNETGNDESISNESISKRGRAQTHIQI